MRVIKAEDRFNELPADRKEAILERADELYAEITKDVSVKFCPPRWLRRRNGKRPRSNSPALIRGQKEPGRNAGFLRFEVQCGSTRILARPIDDSRDHHGMTRSTLAGSECVPRSSGRRCLEACTLRRYACGPRSRRRLASRRASERSALSRRLPTHAYDWRRSGPRIPVAMFILTPRPFSVAKAASVRPPIRRARIPARNRR